MVQSGLTLCYQDPCPSCRNRCLTGRSHNASCRLMTGCSNSVTTWQMDIDLTVLPSLSSFCTLCTRPMFC